MKARRGKAWTCAAGFVTLSAAALVVSLPGCSGTGGVIAEGGHLPDLKVIELASGERISLDRLRDGRAALYAFWASWCIPCRKEVPELNRLASEYGSGDGGGSLAVVGVAMGEPKNVVAVATEELGIAYPVVISPDIEKMSALGIDAIPKLMLVDRDGTVVKIDNLLTEPMRTAITRTAHDVAARLAGAGAPPASADEVVHAGVALPELAGGGGGGGGWPSPWIWLGTLGMAIFLYYTLILIHACSHNVFTSSPGVNLWVGEVLSIMNLLRFLDYRALHRLHHTQTNLPGKDPHYVRPGESWWHYVVTHYPRLVMFTYDPYYRDHAWARLWQGVDRDDPAFQRRDKIRKVFFISGRLPEQSLLGVVLVNLWTVVLATLGIAWWLGGPQAMLYPIALWFVPWWLAQILVADFNFRTHAGLTHRQRPGYDGRDTRSFNRGVWKVINALTFGFYNHQEHHINPGTFWSRPMADLPPAD